MMRVLVVLLAIAWSSCACAQGQTLTYVGPPFDADSSTAGPQHKELSGLKIGMTLSRKLPPNAEMRLDTRDMVLDRERGVVIDELRWTNGAIGGSLSKGGRVCKQGPVCLGLEGARISRNAAENCLPSPNCPSMEIHLSTDDTGRPVKWKIELAGDGKNGRAWKMITQGPIRGFYRQPALNLWRPNLYVGENCPSQDYTSGPYFYPSYGSTVNENLSYYQLKSKCERVETDVTALWVSVPPFPESAVVRDPKEERVRLIAALAWMRDSPSGQLDEPAKAKMGQLWSLQQRLNGQQALYPPLNLARSSAVNVPADLMARAQRAGTFLGNMLRYPSNVALPTIYVGVEVTPVSVWYSFTSTSKQLELAAQALPGILERLSPAEKEFVQTLVKGSPQLFAQINAAIAGDQQALANLTETSKAIQSQAQLQLLADTVRIIEVETQALEKFFSRVVMPKALQEHHFPWDFEAAKAFMVESDMKSAEASAARWMQRKDKEWDRAQRDARVSSELERENARRLSDALGQFSRDLNSSGPTCWDRQEFVLGPGDRPDGESFGLPYVMKKTCR